MTSFARRLAADVRGATAPLFGLMLPVLLGAAAVAVDYALAVETQSELQTGADSAAIAAAREISSLTAARAAALEFGGVNLSNARHGVAIRGSDVVFGAWNPDSRVFTPGGSPVNAVEVTARRADESGNPLATAFAAMLGNPTLAVRANAIAVVTAPAPACMVILDPTDQQALLVNSHARVTASRCDIAVDSSHAAAFQTDGSSRVTAHRVCVTGGHNRRGSSSVSPEAHTGCEPIGDPYAGMAEPPSATCDYTNLSVNSGPQILTPGVYCGNTEFRTGAEVTFQPGTYVFRGGELSLRSDTSLTGSGVSLHFASNGSMDAASSTTLNLSAPTSGTRANVLMSAAVGNTRVQEVSSNTVSRLNGLIYLPSGTLRMRANSVVGDATGSGSPCLQIVARRADIDANARLNLSGDFVSCGLDGGNAAPRVSLVR